MSEPKHDDSRNLDPTFLSNLMKTHAKFLFLSPISLTPLPPEDAAVVVLLLDVVMLLSASDPESELKGGIAAEVEEP